ncbi:unnamed protein product [Microthlaspi erraticum]|uniref:RNase H type-1 domain-containing protein n=1 Tax=Microthlaspi erraticum TaxID=1685480 RepID=A0A6D2KAU3_9BRAS|nr:unnamed protein product [Microthlaspi erraticum]
MAHLFWNLPDNDDMLMYPWLLWFIWKARNYKVFSNDDQIRRSNGICDNGSRAWAAAQTVAEDTTNISITPATSHWESGVRLMEHGKRQTVGLDLDDSAQLVKMVSKPAEWPAFAILLEEVEHCRGMFQAFSLTYIPRTKNTKADKLARSARAQPHDVYYINSVPRFRFPDRSRNLGC